MNLRVCIETGFEGRTLTWALEQPGCFAYGADSDQAANELVAAFADYVDWIAQHDPAPWLEPFIPEIRVEETWEVYTIHAARRASPAFGGCPPDAGRTAASPGWLPAGSRSRWRVLEPA
jgi:hypothetical protein